jgi:hypothetical protein
MVDLEPALRVRIILAFSKWGDWVAGVLIPTSYGDQIDYRDC